MHNICFPGEMRKIFIWIRLLFVETPGMGKFNQINKIQIWVSVVLALFNNCLILKVLFSVGLVILLTINICHPSVYIDF